MRHSQHRAWYHDEVDVLVQMRNEGHTWDEIGERLQRSDWSCRAKFKSTRSVGSRARPSVKAPRNHSAMHTYTVWVPEIVRADRERRDTLAPRDNTAWLCGDPLPGYSALERRR